MGDHRLDQAMHEKNWDLALALIESKQGLRHSDVGWSVLHTAVWQNSPPHICRALLEQSADPNKPDDQGETAVHFAVRFNVSRALLETLLQGGGDVSRVNVYRQTPLRLGIDLARNLDLLMCLIQHGAPLSTGIELGLSSIDYARLLGKHDLVNHFHVVRVFMMLARAYVNFPSRMHRISDNGTRDGPLRIGQVHSRHSILALPIELIRKLRYYL